MSNAALAKKKGKQSLSEKYADPTYILNEMADYLKAGDVESITDLINLYIRNSSQYTQEIFAEKIDVSRGTLSSMLSNTGNVSMNVFMSAIDLIYQDSQSAR